MTLSAFGPGAGIIRTERLTLEPLRREHAAGVFTLASDPRLFEYLETPIARSEAELYDEFTRLEQTNSPDGTERWLNWYAADREQLPVGLLQATIAPQRRSADIGYIIFAPQQHRGYGRESVGAMLRYLRDTGIECITATVDERNEPSLRLLEALGFQATGKHPGISAGKPCTDIRFLFRL